MEKQIRNNPQTKHQPTISTVSEVTDRPLTLVFGLNAQHPLSSHPYKLWLVLYHSSSACAFNSPYYGQFIILISSHKYSKLGAFHALH